MIMSWVDIFVTYIMLLLFATMFNIAYFNLKDENWHETILPIIATTILWPLWAVWILIKGVIKTIKFEKKLWKDI